jgi:DNA processing protein
MTETEQDWLRLHLTPGLGRKGLFRLLQHFATPRTALEHAPIGWQGVAGVRRTGLVPTLSDPQFLAARRQIEQSQARLVSYWDEAYPLLLRDIPDPPALLYLRGAAPPAEALAIVGSRNASPTGRHLTAEIARELASRGIGIVSGLARGIDTAAHEGALAGQGPTVAVLGCGIDRIYPPENERLFKRILAEGGTLVSEYLPGADPLAGNFPGRNRLISGLCRGVLIVEAALGSGSLITADFALEQGRDVFAVPASIASPVGNGVNLLLKDGAFLVTESDDILERLWPRCPSAPVQKQEAQLDLTLPEDARSVYALLGEVPLHIDELVGKCALTPFALSAILLDLELRGGVEQLPGMRYIRYRPSR